MLWPMGDTWLRAGNGGGGGGPGVAQVNDPRKGISAGLVEATNCDTSPTPKGWKETFHKEKACSQDPGSSEEGVSTHPWANTPPSRPG